MSGQKAFVGNPSSAQRVRDGFFGEKKLPQAGAAKRRGRGAHGKSFAAVQCIQWIVAENGSARKKFKKGAQKSGNLKGTRVASAIHHRKRLFAAGARKRRRRQKAQVAPSQGGKEPGE